MAGIGGMVQLACFVLSMQIDGNTLTVHGAFQQAIKETAFVNCFENMSYQGGVFNLLALWKLCVHTEVIITSKSNSE